MTNLPEDFTDLVAEAPDDAKNLTKGQRVEKWLKDQWEFRFNDVKSVSEYRKRSSKTWHAIDDYFLNSVKRKLRDESYFEETKDEETGTTSSKKKYLNTSVAELQQTIESEFSPKVDVIRAYLEGLPWKHYQGNAIQQLIETVTLADWYGPKETAYWHKYLTNWLVATVANAMEDHKCANHVCLVLVGAQGIQKGFWVENLVQNAMGAEYIRTDGNYDPKQKDCKAAIGMYWVIHLDDMLKNLNIKDADAIKHVITAPDVKVRLPYNRKDTWMPHRASFIATENSKEFITDPTGARRFMPFEITAIDWQKYEQINMHDLWTNAMQLYKQHRVNGTRYYDTSEEEKHLEQYKSHFAVEFTEEGLLTQYFRPFVDGVDWMQSPAEGNPVEGGKQGVLMTATEILQEMTTEAGVFRNLSDKRLGNLLKKNGFVKKSAWRGKTSIKAYRLVKLDAERDRNITERNPNQPTASAGVDLDDMDGAF